MEPRCREKYTWEDDSRTERLLRLRQHLHEVMFDQLPVLKDLHRVLDEVALGARGPVAGGFPAASSALLIEPVPRIRDAILAGRDWQRVADMAQREQFGEAASQMSRERAEELCRTFDYMFHINGGMGEGGEAAAE